MTYLNLHTEQCNPNIDDVLVALQMGWTNNDFDGSNDSIYVTSEQESVVDDLRKKYTSNTEENIERVVTEYLTSYFDNDSEITKWKSEVIFMDNKCIICCAYCEED